MELFGLKCKFVDSSKFFYFGHLVKFIYLFYCCHLSVSVTLTSGFSTLTVLVYLRITNMLYIRYVRFSAVKTLLITSTRFLQSTRDGA